jgi:hypothetical protein
VWYVSAHPRRHSSRRREYRREYHRQRPTNTFARIDEMNHSSQLRLYRNIVITPVKP